MTWYPEIKSKWITEMKLGVLTSYEARVKVRSSCYMDRPELARHLQQNVLQDLPTRNFEDQTQCVLC